VIDGKYKMEKKWEDICVKVQEERERETEKEEKEKRWK